MTLTSVSIGAPDPRALADLYAELLGWPVGVGARLHPVQPQDDVRVMLDPTGHPFCLYLS